MSRLTWNALGQRLYEAGVDRGVLYVGSQPGVPWNGLKTIEERTTGGTSKPYYMDGIKYLNVAAPDEYQATLTAYTYPDVFGACDGSSQPKTGLFVTHQSRSSFNLSYRTRIGNDLAGNDYGYRIHLVYNALAAPSKRTHTTHQNTVDPNDFSWDLTTKPTTITGYKPSSHVIIDSRYTAPTVLSSIEDILYGTDSTTSRMPSFAELSTIYDVPTVVVTDNGDGTFSVSGPDSAVMLNSDSTWEITWPTAVFSDGTTYDISS